MPPIAQQRLCEEELPFVVFQLPVEVRDVQGFLGLLKAVLDGCQASLGRLVLLSLACPASLQRPTTATAARNTAAARVTHATNASELSLRSLFM